VSNLYFWEQGVETIPAGACFAKCLKQKSWDACAGECESVRQDGVCLVMLHEMGHWLGLDDEYAETAACPSRERIAEEKSPWSVMDNQYSGWDKIELFARHAKTIFEPMCEGMRLY
jgi:hypothetical protein